MSNLPTDIVNKCLLGQIHDFKALRTQDGYLRFQEEEIKSLGWQEKVLLLSTSVKIYVRSDCGSLYKCGTIPTECSQM
jgi:hypothetical protein